MLTHPQRVQNLENLRQYITEILSHHDQLQVGAFRLTERTLVRRGQRCGMFFCLHGPREVKFTAVWETDHNTILFYGPSGQRFHKTQLPQRVELELETMVPATI